MKEFIDKPPYKWKTVRVFISSTFRDFHAERDYLIKYVFPELRQWCEKYKLHLIDIDLRWGVTKEEAKSGKVIELCLEQIDGCWPFFISMLGSRYGWVPNEIDRSKVNEETLKHFPALKEKWENLSVTHLEIMHAALSPLHRKEPVPHSFFYFRDEKSLPDEDEQKKYTEKERDEYLKTFLESVPQKTEKLEKLKKDIENRFKKVTAERIYPYTPKFDITLPNPEDDKLRGRFTTESLHAFGKRAKEHLRKALESQFSDRIHFLSEKREEDPLANERDFHEAFIENRTTLFIGRTALLKSLHAYVNSDSNKILAVYGESGCGKSALLAKFYREYKFDKDGNEINQDVLFIPHFIGASPSSMAKHSMLRRFCEELKNKFDYEDEIPYDLNKLELTFKAFLKKANNKVIILIDGLNQLDETDRAQELDWLPYELKENVKIIASTLEGKAKDSLKRLTNEELIVGELDKDERREIIREMPSVFAKTLEEKHIKILLKKKATSNPLYLKVALEELRIFGSFDKLEVKVKELPETVIAMFVDVIERLEKEVDKELVERLFCLLECSRHGLTNNELEELLHDDKKDHIIILRQLRDYFISRDGVLDFFHRGLSKAVRQKYDLKNKAIKWHKMLAKYFENQNIYIEKDDKKSSNRRKLFELPFQQTYGYMWNELYNTLTDTEFLEQKNIQFNVYDLLGDYRMALGMMPYDDEVGKQRSVIQAFSMALNQASFVLKESPELTFPQIYNQLRWQAEKEETLKKKLKIEQNHYTRPWLSLQSKPAQSKNLIRTFTGHTDAVRTCAFSPDGKLIVSGSWDKTLKLWEADSGEELITLRGHTDKVNACSFSPDGKLIASGSDDKTIILWDAKTYEKRAVLTGHQGAVKSCAFNSESNLLISGGDYKEEILIIWNLKTGAIIRKLKENMGSIDACAFSPDDKQIVSGGKLILWDAGSGRKRATIGDRGAEDCAFSPDGRRLVLAGGLFTLQVWDIETGEKFGEMDIPGGYDDDYQVQACAYSPTGKQIVSGVNEELRLWNAETCEELSIFKGHSGIVNTCTYSPDGKYIISGSWDKTLKLWHSQPKEEVEDFTGHSNYVSKCSFSPDGKHVISAGAGSNNSEVIILWDVESKQNIAIYEDFMWATHCVFSPDGKRIASASKNAFMIRDIKSKKVITKFEGWIDYVYACTFSPDGKLIVSSGGTLDEAELILWETTYGKKKKTFKGHTTEVNDCDFSPDGRFIISGGGDKMLKIWDVEAGEENLSLEGHKGSISSCIYHPNGQIVITAGGSDSLYSGKLFGELILWDINKRNDPVFLSGHKNKIQTCDISPDGRKIITGSEDKTLKLWDTLTGEEIFTFIGFTSGVTTCEFSPDGTHIIVGDNQGQIILLGLENFVTYPLIITPFKKLGRILYTCRYCQLRTKIKSSELGQESFCSHCHKPLRFNPFIIGGKERATIEFREKVIPEPKPKQKDHLTFFKQGKSFYTAKKYNIAIQAFKETIQIKPDYELAYYFLGLAYKAQGKLDIAKSSFKIALRFKRNTIDVHYNLGLVYSEQGDTAEAKYHFKHALDLGHEQAKSMLENLMSQEKTKPVSKPNLKRKNLTNHFNKANILLDDGKINEAIFLFKEAIPVEPNADPNEYLPEAYRNPGYVHFCLGLQYEKKGNIPEAEYHFLKAIKMGNKPAKVVLDSMRGTEKPPGPKPKPIRKDHIGEFNRGYSYFKAGKIKEAIRAYLEAIEIKPNYEKAYFNLALAYEKSINLQKAIDAYKEAIRSKPDYTNAFLNLGAIYYNKGQLNEAKIAFNKALKFEEKNKKTHFNLGLIFNKEGNIPEAEYHFKRSLELGLTRAKSSLDKLEKGKIKTRPITKMKKEKSKKWWKFWKR